MDAAEVRRMLAATGEEIRDQDGTILGYVVQPARFKLDRAYLALGGFLVVTRDEDTGEYIGTEFDALPHPKSREPYPAGHSQQAFRAANLDEALQHTLAHIPSDDLQS